MQCHAAAAAAAVAAAPQRVICKYECDNLLLDSVRGGTRGVYVIFVCKYVEALKSSPSYEHENF